MMTRDEHMKWCKERAHREYDFCKAKNAAAARQGAIASMLSDLGKHPETKGLIESCAILMFTVHDEVSLFRFIDGFN